MGGYKNTEGYPDPTAGMAIHEVQKEEKRKEHNEAVSTLITMLKQIISLAGFELVGRIVLRIRKQERSIGNACKLRGFEETRRTEGGT